MKSNTVVTVLITAVVMLLLFAFTIESKEPTMMPQQIEYRIPPRDYQVEIAPNGKQLIIWDNDRFVGTLPLTMINSLGRLVLNDND